jgi:hypothetical protein
LRGRTFEATQATQVARAADVALLGRNAARQLGVAAADLSASLYIGGIRVLVEDVVGAVALHGEVLSAVQRGWAPIVALWLPLLGTVTGLLAGSYPAMRRRASNPSRRSPDPPQARRVCTNDAVIAQRIRESRLLRLWRSRH